MNDRYLWDASGPPEADVERLEELLRAFRHRGRPPVVPRRPGRRIIPPAVLLAAAVIAAALGALLYARVSPARDWRVARLAGSPSVAQHSLHQAGRLGVGQWLETDAASRARVEIRGLGRFDVEPGSRLRLVAASWLDQRLALARGKIVATISAPPRLFSVETPSATAVDLGCEYALSVDADGSARISVSRGWVELGWGGLEAIVPAGYVDATRPGKGPGTPWIENAPGELVLALERFDLAADPSALARILGMARPADALSLWHLLARTKGDERVRVYETLARLSPPPPGVDRAGALALDPEMLELWRFEMGTPLLPRRLTPWRAFWARLTHTVFG